MRDSAECAHRIIATTMAVAAAANGLSRLLEPTLVQVAVAFVRRRSSLVKLDLLDSSQRLSVYLLSLAPRAKRVAAASQFSFRFFLFSYFIFYRHTVSLGECDNNTHCKLCVCCCRLHLLFYWRE